MRLTSNMMLGSTVIAAAYAKKLVYDTYMKNGDNKNNNVNNVHGF
jgi:hypothetical protein